jgi:hypothetical protein
MLQSNKPMLRARKAQRPSPGEVGISKLRDVDDQWFAMLLEAQQLDECGVLLSVADGVQAEDGRLGGWVQVREPQPQPQPQPTVGLRAVTPHRDVVRHAGVARSEQRVRTLPDVGQPDVVRVRVEHDDPDRRLRRHTFEQEPERVGLGAV